MNNLCKLHDIHGCCLLLVYNNKDNRKSTQKAQKILTKNFITKMLSTLVISQNPQTISSSNFLEIFILTIFCVRYYKCRKMNQQVANVDHFLFFYWFLVKIRFKVGYHQPSFLNRVKLHSTDLFSTG